LPLGARALDEAEGAPEALDAVEALADAETLALGAVSEVAFPLQLSQPARRNSGTTS